MSISALPLALASIAESLGAPVGKRPPRNRIVLAKPDEKKTPEAR